MARKKSKPPVRTSKKAVALTVGGVLAAGLGVVGLLALKSAKN